MNSYEERAIKFLRHAEGRKAIEKLLGAKIQIVSDAEKAAAEEAERDRPIIALLVPVYDHPDPRMSDAVSKMIQASREHCQIFAGPPVSSSVIHWSRNWLIAELLKTQKSWTHVLFLDDDIVPTADSLLRLLSHKKDIIAGLCTRRTDPPIPNIRKFFPDTGVYAERWTWPKNELIEVDAVGTGMMLISRHALEQVAQAYFDCLHEKEVFAASEEKIAELREARLKYYDDTANAYWFRFLTALSGAAEMGEDISFCFVAQRYCGLKIYCDTAVTPGHVGDYVYSIQDFLPHQEVVIRRAKAQELAKRRAEEPTEESRGITVMIPTRARPAELRRSVSALLSTATNPDDLRIIARFDNDDESRFAHCDASMKWFAGPRHGYRNLHLYYNEIAEHAKGDWLMFWNDDAIMQEQGWDEKIRKAGAGLKIINPTGEMNLFPIVHRSLYELLGHLSLQAHSDTWLQVIGRECLIEQYIPMQIAHERAEINDTYKVTSPEFFSEEVQKLLMADVNKVMAALESQQQVLAVG